MDLVAKFFSDKLNETNAVLERTWKNAKENKKKTRENTDELLRIDRTYEWRHTVLREEMRIMNVNWKTV